MEKYNTCFEALTQEFDFYDDEAEQILKALPELTENSYWNKYNQNIMQAIDIALYFGNTQESIVKYPKFIVTPPKSLLAKAALSILKKPDTSIVDTWTLSHSTFLTGVTATMNAILQGDLPNGYDIFTHTNESEKLLNLSKGEFVSKYRPQIQDYEYIMQNLKQYRPDTFEQLSSKFPDCFVNATTPVTISENHHNAEPVVEPSKKQNIEPGQMKSQQALNVTQDIIDDNSKQDTLLINKLNDISEAQTVRQSIDTYSHICQKYNISPKELKDRLDFIKIEFPGINMKQVQTYLLESKNLLSCSEQTIQKAKMLMQILFKAKPEQLKYFVKSKLNFPYLETEKLQKSFEVIEKFNLPITLANYHPGIYTIPADELENRIKLAQIINISSKDFFERMYKFPADLVFAKLQAFKKGETTNPLMYVGNSSFFEKTGITTEYLLEKYPFTDEKQKYLDEQFEIIKNTYGVFWPTNEHNYKRLRNGDTIYDQLRTQYKSIIRSKLEMLIKHGYNLEDINPYSSIISYDINRLELKFKLARLNNIPDKEFLADKFAYSEHEIYARMKALENGEINKNISIYISAGKLQNITGIDTENLIKKYPLNDEAKTEINRRYASLIQSSQSTKNNSTDPQTFSDGKMPNFDFSEEDKTLFKTIKSFDAKETNIKSEELTTEKINFLCDLFDATESELTKMFKRSPLISVITPDIIKNKSSYLFKNYNLSYDDFISGIQNYPYLAIKTPEEYDAFFKFCDKYLMLDLAHSRQLLVNHPYSISTNPELLLKKCKTIAQSMDVPFEIATAAISEKPRVTLNALNTLENKVKTALDLGIKKDQLLQGLNFLATNPLDMKLKYMINSLAGKSVEDLLLRNYLINPAKLYSRLMFNFDYDKSIDIGASEKVWAKLMENATIEDARIPAYLANEPAPTEILMQMYPLSREAMKQVEIMYNLQKPTNKMRFTEEEFNHERV